MEMGLSGIELASLAGAHDFLKIGHRGWPVEALPTKEWSWWP